MPNTEETLAAWLQTHQPTATDEEKWKTAWALTNALVRAHAEGKADPDFDPSSIKVTESEAAFQARTNTPEIAEDDALRPADLYTSPEALRGAPASKTDTVYALGALLYHAYAGQTPFFAETRYGLSLRHLHDEHSPLPAHVPDKIRVIIEKALAKTPANRWESIYDMQKALNVANPRPARPRVSRAGWLIPLLFVGLLLVFLAFSLLTMRANPIASTAATAPTATAQPQATDAQPEDVLGTLSLSPSGDGFVYELTLTGILPPPEEERYVLWLVGVEGEMFAVGELSVSDWAAQRAGVAPAGTYTSAVISLEVAGTLLDSPGNVLYIGAWDGDVMRFFAPRP